ncbi:MAG: hypothetical protein Q7T26_07420 [Dehalococcoidia bacterium]|nr:hypothetical protein [Dehalococcoidia bacterium]
MERTAKTGQVVMLDPVGQPETQGQRISSRVADLNGKSIGFLFNGGYSGELVFNHIRQRLGEAHRFANAMSLVKPNVCAPAPKAMIEEIANSCDVAVVGVGV